jgi:hypothetical protein
MSASSLFVMHTSKFYRIIGGNYLFEYNLITFNLDHIFHHWFYRINKFFLL